MAVGCCRFIKGVWGVMQYYFFKLLALFFTVIRWIFIAIILIVIVGMLAPVIQDANQYAYMRHIVAIDAHMNTLIRQYLPTVFFHRDISHFLLLLLAMIFSSTMSGYAYEFNYKARMINLKRETDQLRGTASVDGKNTEKLAKLDQTLAKIQSSGGRKEREQLLKEFVSIKRQLETMGRNLAFLSVDVVDSTGMKETEDPIVVSYDFAEYRKFAEGKLNNYGCIKSTWTPDGIMSCFNTVEEAVKAGTSLIEGLVEFNRSVKAMKHDFAIRCGINAGYLLFDDTLPLEEISDRVIDIAGHMQKYAAPNTIYIAKNVVVPIEAPQKFKSASKVVDDLDVYVWMPDSKEVANHQDPKS
jgi:class 3 adenylate cyclase